MSPGRLSTEQTSSVPSVTTDEVRRALRAREEIALLDVREEGAFADAHPLFAASLPIGRIETEVLDRIPRLTTRVVVYDNGEGLIADAVDTLRALGYHDVSQLAGGLDGWRQAGGPEASVAMHGGRQALRLEGDQ